jgi:hypothetical protein
MFLKNQLVYIQFHPVVYIVKLNIEMSMASLVVRLAQGKPENDMFPEAFHDSSHNTTATPNAQRVHIQSIQLKPKKGVSDIMSLNESDESLGGIHCQTDLNVVSERVEVVESKRSGELSSRTSREGVQSVFDDDAPLRKGGVVRKF